MRFATAPSNMGLMAGARLAQAPSRASLRPSSVRRQMRSVQVSAFMPHTYNSFDDILTLSNKIPCLVEFYASWCGPCQLQARELPRVQGAFKEQLKVIKINADRYPEICSRFGVSALPTLMLFKDARLMEGYFTSGDIISRVVYITGKGKGGHENSSGFKI